LFNFDYHRPSHKDCDAFRAAGYTPDQLNAYTTIVEKRIAELNQL